MHELFLTTTIPADDLSRSLRVLQGYSGQRPQHLFTRRLIFEGPRSRTLTGIDPKFIERQPRHKQLDWKSLNDQLIRQSYVVSLNYDIAKDQFPKSDDSSVVPEPILCDQIPGTLRWNEIPDPASILPLNSRSAISVSTDDGGICSLLQSMGYRFTKESIVETHRFIHSEIVFRVTRYLEVPLNIQGANSASQHKVSEQLPPFESLVPFDAEDKWLLTATIEVSNGSDQELMKNAVGELTTVKDELTGCFDLKTVDRFALDTKVKV